MNPEQSSSAQQEKFTKWKSRQSTIALSRLADFLDTASGCLCDGETYCTTGFLQVSTYELSKPAK